MKKILLPFLLFSFSITLSAQQVFQFGYKDIWASSQNYDIIQTSDNGYVIIGDSWENTIMKVDENGDSLWVTSLRDSMSTAFYQLRAVTECANSDLIIVSYDINNNTSLISRLNTSGDTIWNKAYSDGGMGSNKVYDLKELSTGEIGIILNISSYPSIIKLSSSGSLIFEQTSYENSTQAFISNHDEFLFIHNGNITKLDINGNFVWSKTMYLDLGAGLNYISITSINKSNSDNYLARFYDSNTSTDFIAIFDSSMALYSSCLDINSLAGLGGTLKITQTKDDSLFITQSNNGFSGEYRIAKFDSTGLAGPSNHFIPSFMGLNNSIIKQIPTSDSGAVILANNFLTGNGQVFIGKFYKGVENGDCEGDNPFTTNLGNYSSVATFSSSSYSPSFTTYLSPAPHYVNKVDLPGFYVSKHNYNEIGVSFSYQPQTCAESNQPMFNPENHLTGIVNAYVSGGYPNASAGYNYIWTTLPQQQAGSYVSNSSQQYNISFGWAAVSATDTKCLSVHDSIYIAGPDTIKTQVDQYNIQCAGNTLTLNSTVTGGTGNIDYNWSDQYNNNLLDCSNCTTPNITADSTGWVYLLVTDSNYCQKLDSTFVEALLVNSTPICMVSVDSTSTKNVIVWSKPASDAIDYFNIYRDIVGTYTYVASVPYDSLSQFVDTTNGVNPNITQYRYKISNVDTCGYESPLSDYHQTIYLSTPNFTGSLVELNWQAYDGFDYNFFYRILRDSMSTGDWEVIDSVSNTTFVYSDITPPIVNIGTTRYLIEIAFAGTCDATKAANYSSSRSNRPTTQGSGIIAPVANFTANTTTITEGSSIVFTDQSTNNPTSWAWTFDGGTPSTSTAQNPGSILYSTAGVYNVSLTVGNSAGTDGDIKIGYITVVSGGLAPTADFLSSNTTIVVGDSIQFSDISTNLPTSWAWSFDGGTPSTSTAQNPGYIIYNSTGTYNVTLTASNTIGTDQEIKTAYVTVVSAISGDINGNGTIDAGETAGDTNNDGIITGSELAGDLNGNGEIDGSEIAGDIDGNGAIDNGEIAGDVTGDGAIGPNELTGDVDGNGYINVNEVLGDANGNGVLDNGEVNSIEHINSEITVNIYPNPNNGYFVMELNTSEKAVIVNIYNNIGQRVLSEAYQCNGELKKEYDISQFGAGIYNIEININGESTSKRLIVK